MPSLNLGFLPRQGRQGSSWPRSCSGEEVSVLGRQLLIGKTQATRSALCAPSFCGLRGAVAFIAPLPLEQGDGWEAGASRSLPELFDLLPPDTWTDSHSPLCEGWAWVLAAPGWTLHHSHPPICTDGQTAAP